MNQPNIDIRNLTIQAGSAPSPRPGRSCIARAISIGDRALLRRAMPLDVSIAVEAIFDLTSTVSGKDPGTDDGAVDGILRSVELGTSGTEVSLEPFDTACDRCGEAGRSGVAVMPRGGASAARTDHAGRFTLGTSEYGRDMSLMVMNGGSVPVEHVASGRGRRSGSGISRGSKVGELGAEIKFSSEFRGRSRFEVRVACRKWSLCES